MAGLRRPVALALALLIASTGVAVAAPDGGGCDRHQHEQDPHAGHGAAAPAAGATLGASQFGNGEACSHCPDATCAGAAACSGQTMHQTPGPVDGWRAARDVTPRLPVPPPLPTRFQQPPTPPPIPA